jgi:hypothetical protein
MLSLVCYHESEDNIVEWQECYLNNSMVEIFEYMVSHCISIHLIVPCATSAGTYIQNEMFFCISSIDCLQSVYPSELSMIICLLSTGVPCSSDISARSVHLTMYPWRWLPLDSYNHGI